MPWAPNRVANDQPVSERRVIVRTGRVNGKEFIPYPRNQHRIITDMTGQHTGLPERLDGHTTGQIGTLLNE
jgi:hypothetical protein